MEEAAHSNPSGLYDRPRRTVLTHFLDLAGSDRFFPTIELWTKKGWVEESMTCAIHRARYKALAAVPTRSAEAREVADFLIDRARSGAAVPDRVWEIGACLDEAPFLTESSTASLRPYLALVSDLTEPRTLREGVLRGMTGIYVRDPASLRANDPGMDKVRAQELSVAEVEAGAGRLGEIVKQLRSTTNADTDSELLARGTAFGAMEIERVMILLGRTFLGRFAVSQDPFESDLAWGWVRTAKAGKRIGRHEGLGLWDRNREPEGDAFWYLCFEGKEAISLRARDRLVDPDRVRIERCATGAGRASMSEIRGPYPLEATARSVVPSVVVVRRILLEKEEA